MAEAASTEVGAEAVFTVAVAEVSTVAVGEASIAAAVVRGLVGAVEAIAEAAPTEAPDLSGVEVLTPAEAFVVDRRVAATEAVEVRTADSVHRAA